MNQNYADFDIIMCDECTINIIRILSIDPHKGIVDKN